MRSLAPTAASNLGRPMPPRLSIDQNRFTLIDSAGNKRMINALTLDIVIIDLNDHTSKMYFGRDYNPNDTEPPVCWSDNGQAPSSQALTPQSEKCMLCPHNAIGSAISKFSAAKVKACVDMKKTAFYIPGEQGIYLMTIKPGSFKNWSAYVNMLAGQKSPQKPGGVELYEVATRLEFESQGVLKFSPVGWSNLEEAQANFDRGVTPEIVGANDVPFSGQLAAPAAQQTLPPPVQSIGTVSQPSITLNQQPQVQQPVPFVPVPNATTTPSPSPLAAATTQPVLTPQPSEPAKRTRRTKAQIEADNAAAAAKQSVITPKDSMTTAFPNPQPAPAPAFMSPQAQTATPPQGQAAVPNADGLDIPDFLKAAPKAQPAAPAVQPAQFGLAQPAQPSQDLQAAIDAAFALPTG